MLTSGGGSEGFSAAPRYPEIQWRFDTEPYPEICTLNYGSGSCSFLQWLSICMQNLYFFKLFCLLPTLHLYHTGTYLILVGWFSMAQVAPLRECPSIVVVSTVIRPRSIHLGASHHCCSVVFVAIFELFHSHSLFQRGRYFVPSVNNSLRKEVSPGLKPAWCWGLRLSGSATLRVALPVTVTDLNQVSLFTMSFPVTILYVCTMSAWWRLSSRVRRPTSFNLS